MAPKCRPPMSVLQRAHRLDPSSTSAGRHRVRSVARLPLIQMLPRQLFTLAAAAVIPVATLAGGAAGQVVGGDVWGGSVTAGPMPESAVTAVADSLLFREGEAGRALAVREEALSRTDAYALHWRAARAATALGVLNEATAERRDSLYRAAIAHGQAAVEADPRGVDGLYWRVAAKGRLSLSADAGSAASLANEIEREARELLVLDSLNAGGHHALGRLNLEVMTLPRWKRAVARALLGNALKRTNWALAERHLLRAVELEPGNALYLRDLGALHYVRDRPTAARILFERLEERTGLLPWDEIFRGEAMKMLAEIDEASR